MLELGCENATVGKNAYIELTISQVGTEAIEGRHRARVGALAELVRDTPNLVALGPAYQAGGEAG